MVWDRIEHPDVAPVERWGGISYSLAAAAAVVPAGWSIRPIIKVGSDLADRAEAFLETVPGLERPGGVVRVDEPNNRVRLRYRDRQHRDEILSGGVPPWAWSELEPLLEGLDALYINLISGFELPLSTARQLEEAGAVPLYADLHSLLLGIGEDGERKPRRLAQRDAWLRCFDIVQVNEPELDLVVGDDRRDSVIQAALRTGTAAILVTRGRDGARWYARSSGPRPWRHGAGEPREGKVDLPGGGRTGDPTGCGDVWGATCFVALVDGEPVEAAVTAGNRAAARSVSHRGADGLYEQLRNTT